MAELKAPRNYMELSLGNEDPSIGEPPIRMLFTDVSEPVTPVRIIGIPQIDPFHPTKVHRMSDYLSTRIDGVITQLDAAIADIDNIKVQLERLNQPWYRRLWNWLISWLT